MVRRVGNVGAIYGSPKMLDLGPDEDSREQVEPRESSKPEPWFDAREAARGWGLVAVFGVSVYATFRLISWLASILFT